MNQNRISLLETLLKSIPEYLAEMLGLSNTPWIAAFIDIREPSEVILPERYFEEVAELLITREKIARTEEQMKQLLNDYRIWTEILLFNDPSRRLHLSIPERQRMEGKSSRLRVFFRDTANNINTGQAENNTWEYGDDTESLLEELRIVSRETYYDWLIKQLAARKPTFSTNFVTARIIELRRAEKKRNKRRPARMEELSETLRELEAKERHILDRIPEGLHNAKEPPCTRLTPKQFYNAVNLAPALTESGITEEDHVNHLIYDAHTMTRIMKALGITTADNPIERVAQLVADLEAAKAKVAKLEEAAKPKPKKKVPKKKKR